MADFNRPQTYPLSRLKVIWAIFIVMFTIVCLRLFYVQIIKHDEFSSQADAIQIKSLEIEAERGSIYAFNGNRKVPLVTNERRWTMFSDAKFIEDLPGLLEALESLGVELTDHQRQALADGSRYTVLRRGLTDSQQKQIVDNLTHKGVYFQKQSIRQYTEGDLASQVLGFLNAESKGRYGIEQFYNEELTGIPGYLQATTDVHDIPLLFVEDNISVEPQAGQDLILTLDVPLQRLVEDSLVAGIVDTDAQGGAAVVLNAETGAVLAMANYPNFDPANFREADYADYVNDTVESVLEPASVMKVLLMATTLDRGAIDIDDNYYNPEFQSVNGLTISNLFHYDAGYRPVTDILSLSLNTGTVEMLKRLGDGPKDTIDLSDRQVLYDYYKNRFRLTQLTGIDLPNEVSGFMNMPDYRWSPNHLYSTMTFGQSITVTPLQLASAYAAIFNGGNYYRPYVAAQVGDIPRQPELLESNILKPQTITDLRELMSVIGGTTLDNIRHDKLELSAKTGSAQVVDFEAGGYVEDAETGLMAGYIKGNRQTLVILTIVEDPQVFSAGSGAARPVWVEIAKNIIASGRVNP